MKFKNLNEYARLAIRKGVNVQRGQTLLINVKAEHYYFARLLVKEAYDSGAKKVIVKWSDDFVSKEHYLNQSIDELSMLPTWIQEEYDSYLTEDLCRLSVYAPSPELFDDVDSEKLSAVSKANAQAFKKMAEYSMSNQGQWSLIALPTPQWARFIFPNDSEENAMKKLYEAILYAVRIDGENDPLLAWDEHNNKLRQQNETLNRHRFKSLHFKNEKGTDIVVGLAKNHIWAGGEEVSKAGYKFNPNMPTEESFTMPDKNNVNGVVYNTKPLNYNGQLIDEFYLVFKDGEVIDFDAKKGKHALKQLLDTDEGSRRIGEIALISHDSPISNLDILFYNTLFDENASCHMALGKAYPMNIEGGTKMNAEELTKAGANDSLIHEDFMFGSEDMSIFGLTFDGKEIQVFKDGNFVI